ncbi:hypothetical protein M378DRAFT_164105 [Amanita muscaria Koide BX008]|uniref:Uncharacterized protein n=1 Tax=Amanita muscaria (strain Koide BX008) TaxID=946122 RepID=A0A0C2TAF7_AMAMK|nr:hypothetical protein M378DRAFT_164105 [Amanita muscaria Koide BX008]
MFILSSRRSSLKGEKHDWRHRQLKFYLPESTRFTLGLHWHINPNNSNNSSKLRLAKAAMYPPSIAAPLQPYSRCTLNLNRRLRDRGSCPRFLCP